LKVTARANGDDPLIADAARSSLDHFEGLVDHALGQMFTPTIAFEDDGSMWTAPVVETAVAA
jgi:hypothetical protein